MNATTTQRHGTGYKPSDPAKLARFKHVSHLLGTGFKAPNPPAAASLEQFTPDVFDQGQTSSCGGHGTACGVATALKAKGAPLPFVPSPKGIYDDARAAAGENPLTDDGIDPETLLTSLSTNGVRAIQAPTADGRYSDCDPATINVPETAEQNAAASQDLLVGEYAIDPRDPAFGALVASCLAAGVPVGVGIPADSWQTWSAGAPMSGAVDSNQADHWVCVIAFTTTASGQRIFTIRNSWGKDWGDAGNIEVTEEWLASGTAEAIAFAVNVPCPGAPAVTP